MSIGMGGHYKLFKENLKFKLKVQIENFEKKKWSGDMMDLSSNLALISLLVSEKTSFTDDNICYVTRHFLFFPYMYVTMHVT